MIEDTNEAASTAQELREDEEHAQLRSDAMADLLAGGVRPGSAGHSSALDTGVASGRSGATAGGTDKRNVKLV